MSWVGGGDELGDVVMEMCGWVEAGAWGPITSPDAPPQGQEEDRTLVHTQLLLSSSQGSLLSVKQDSRTSLPG